MARSGRDSCGLAERPLDGAQYRMRERGVMRIRLDEVHYEIAHRYEVNTGAMRIFLQIDADSGFAAVRTYVASKMRGVSPNGSVTFSKKTDHPSTTLVSKDLNHSIHGVIFYLDGSIIVDAVGHWKGNLTVSFSDPYDFLASDPDWRVRVWGRLYNCGWISKFNATGSWTVNFEE